MKDRDIEQLETIYKELYSNLDLLYSVENSIMSNVDALDNIGFCPENAYKIRADIQNVIEELSLLCKASKKYIESYIMCMKITAPPLVVHQDISQLINSTIFQFCKEHNLHYRILSAPVKVVLNEKGKYYEPDIIVVFDSEKIKRDGCYGAPDIIFEIVSKSTKKVDYEEKKRVYLENGVKEYFIVDPIKKNTVVYYDKREVIVKKFSENLIIENIPGLIINIHDLLSSYLF